MDNEILKYKEALKKAAKKINELDEALKGSTSTREVAIIGYNCRFPGGANNVEQYWNLLTEGYDAVTKVKQDRFDVDKYYSNVKGDIGKTFTKYASFLDTDIKSFDNVHFEMSAKEAVSIDPQHRLLLEVSWEALENSGLDIDELKGSNTGVFVGIDSNEYTQAELFTNNVDDISTYTLVGVSSHAVAGRLSYFYDFKGPAVTCNTACSSSLVALNMAVESLRNGQCDLAVVGGVNLLLSPVSFVGLSQFNALSEDGRCKTFDDFADGFGRGEGCGVVILKCLSNAQKDGNTIEGLVKGACIGQDGKSNGFFAPNGLAESRVIKQALKFSGLSADDIDYIEAHGTGTSLGDFIETQAVCDAFKNKKEAIKIGSVKSNIGHLEAASGMASLIKILLSMKHKQIPPSIHVNTPNHNVDWDKIKVVRELTDWNKEKGKRRAGINAFGISGTLAHVIIEEPDQNMANEETKIMPHYLLTLSAKSKKSLKNYIMDIKNTVNNDDKAIGDIAYSTNITRSHMKYKFAIVGKDKNELIGLLDKAIESDEFFEYNSNLNSEKRCKIAFLFTGQGSIYPNIAKQLYGHSKEFSEMFDLCDEQFKKILGISIKDAVYGEDVSLLSSPLYSQPVIFSVEYSLTKVWDTVGIKPTVVIGHSIGEYAAACYAGLISFEDATQMIALRGKLVESVNVEGKMVGVLTDATTMEKAILDSGCKNVSIAAVNAPKNVTISGVKSEVDKVIEVLKKTERVFINDLKIMHPYHSVIMNQYEPIYRKSLEGIHFQKTNIDVISCVSGKIENNDILGNSEYWAKHLSQTVNFQSAIKEAEKQGINIFIEVGGNATLSGLAGQCITENNVLFLPSLRNGVDDYAQLLDSIKALYLRGVKIGWDKFYYSYRKQKVGLPNYYFQRKEFWKDVIKCSCSENSTQNSNISAEENVVNYRKIVQDEYDLQGTNNQMSILNETSESKVKEYPIEVDEEDLMDTELLQILFDNQYKIITEQNEIIKCITE